MLPGEVESSEFMDPADIATFFTGAPLAAGGIKGVSGMGKGLLSAIRSFLSRKGGGVAFDPTRRSLMKAGLGVAGAASSIGGEMAGTILTGASKEALGKMPMANFEAVVESGSIHPHTIKSIINSVTNFGYKVIGVSPQDWNNSIVDVMGKGGKVARIMVSGRYGDEPGLASAMLKSIMEPDEKLIGKQSISDITKMAESSIIEAFKHEGFDPKVLDIADKGLLNEAIRGIRGSPTGWYGLGEEHATALLKGEISPDYLRGLISARAKASLYNQKFNGVKSTIDRLGKVPDHISSRIAKEMADKGVPEYWQEGQELIAKRLTEYSKEGGYDPTHIVAKLLMHGKDRTLSMSQGGEKVYKGIPTVGRSIISNPIFQLNPKEFMTTFWDDLLTGLEQKSPGIIKDIYQQSLPKKLREKSVLQRNIEDVRSIANIPKLPEKLGKKLERKIRGIPKKIEKEIVDALGGANTEKEITDVLDIINKGGTTGLSGSPKILVESLEDAIAAASRMSELGGSSGEVLDEMFSILNSKVFSERDKALELVRRGFIKVRKTRKK